MCPDVISPMITYDIKKKFASSRLSIERRRSRNAVVGGRDLRYASSTATYSIRPPWLAEISRGRRFISIFLALRPRRGELLSLGIGAEEGPARVLSFYYIASGRGEADAQLFMPVSRPIERIGHISYTYLPRIRIRGGYVDVERVTW